MRIVTRTSALLAVFAVATMIGVGPAASQPKPAHISTDGADLLAVTVDGGELSVQVRDRAGAAAKAAGLDPTDVVIGGAAATTGRVPGNPAFGFLGRQGEQVWALVGQDTTVPAMDATGVPAGEVTVELRDVQGPAGQGTSQAIFHAYTLSGVGVPRVQLGSGQGAPRTMTLAAGTRTGTIWAFGAPGDYRITLAVTAPVAGGETVTQDVTYRVAVPGEAPASDRAGLPAAMPPLFAQPAPAQDLQNAQTGDRKIFADGHIDMGARFVDGTWTVQLRDDTVSPPAWRNLADCVLHAVDASKINVPENPQLGFLGPPGSQVWMLPQIQQAGILWPGWNTQDPSTVSGVPGNVTWTLHEVQGPGKFVLFLTGAFGQPEVLFDSANSLPQQLAIPPNTHAHGNWVFTQQGVYHLRIEMSGTTGTGARVSDTRTVNVAAGAVDPNTAFSQQQGNNNQNQDNQNNPGGGLALTGADILMIAIVGLVLLGGGAVLLGVLRANRRRHRPPA